MVRTSDRRIQMTKRMLKEELVRVSASRDPDEVTIKEICEGAGVSRVTFYKYYGSVHDLMEETAKSAMEKIFEEGEPDASEMENIVRYIMLNRSLYLLLIEKGYYEKFMAEYLKKRIRQSGIADEESEITKAQTQYAVSGLSGLMQYCLKTEPDITPKKLAALILRFHKSWDSDVSELKDL